MAILGVQQKEHIAASQQKHFKKILLNERGLNITC